MTKLEPIIKEIKNRLSDARNKAASEVHTAMIQAYWDIGRIIIEYEQDGNVKAQYGANLLPELSKRLTTELGRGFSRSNLQNMRNLYLEYPICQTLSGKLTWSHYCELLGISDKNERDFNSFNSCNSMTSSLIKTRRKGHRIERIARMKTKDYFSINSFNSRNSMINSCNSMTKKGEKTEYSI
jgi:hypothetical protein